MTSAQVLDIKGKSVREVALEDAIFGIEPNKGLLHTALIRQLANGRSGSANTKTRAEVRGGGKKPWRQKGTGRARAGSIRSPLWEGGGVIFGPKPRDFSITLPKKQRVLAVKSALAAKRDAIVVVESFDSLQEVKTKVFAQALKDMNVSDKRVLLVLDYANDNDKKVCLSARNICGLKVISVSNLNVKDLLHAEVVLTTERSLQAINDRFKSTAKTETEKESAGAKKTKTAEAPAKLAKEKAAEPKEAAPKKAAKPKKDAESKE